MLWNIEGQSYDAAIFNQILIMTWVHDIVQYGVIELAWFLSGISLTVTHLSYAGNDMAADVLATQRARVLTTTGLTTGYSMVLTYLFQNILS